GNEGDSGGDVPAVAVVTMVRRLSRGGRGAAAEDQERLAIGLSAKGAFGVSRKMCKVHLGWQKHPKGAVGCVVSS
nr:hypothetical protein [Tanacetum cinerariifolium]